MSDQGILHSQNHITQGAYFQRGLIDEATLCLHNTALLHLPFLLEKEKGKKKFYYVWFQGILHV
jgi:hypothetical protein